MAKKSSINIEDDQQSIFSIISAVDKSAEILAESKTAVIKVKIPRTYEIIKE